MQIQTSWKLGLSRPARPRKYSYVKHMEIVKENIKSNENKNKYFP